MESGGAIFMKSIQLRTGNSLGIASGKIIVSASGFNEKR
jgi:hypothetical protein